MDQSESLTETPVTAQSESLSAAHAAPHAAARISTVERWVQFTFIALAVVIAYVVDNLGSFIIDRFYEVPSWFGYASALIGIVGSFLLYKNSKTQDTVRGVCEELGHVTWPTREKTWESTIIVIVASLVAAIYCGGFDAFWSAMTDYVYRR